MASQTVSVPAATAVVGYDLLTSIPEAQISGSARVLRMAAIAGSAASGDTQVDVRVGGRRIGSLINGSIGGIDLTRDARYFAAYVPAGSRLQLLVVAAPATSPINAAIDYDE